MNECVCVYVCVTAPFFFSFHLYVTPLLTIIPSRSIERDTCRRSINLLVVDRPLEFMPLVVPLCRVIARAFPSLIPIASTLSKFVGK